MTNLYQDILKRKAKGEKLLALLLDPEKTAIDDLANKLCKLKNTKVSHIFVGGSTNKKLEIDAFVKEIKKNSTLPVILFPGHPNQISDFADGLLFLSLVSGRNPLYLIDYHVQSAISLKRKSLEIISTGYILIDGGVETSVQKVSQTKPIKCDDIEHVISTAIASQLLGMKLIYLEAGSGAINRVSSKCITQVKNNIELPLIVGGGLKSMQDVKEVWKAGADLAVVGTAFEMNSDFFI